MEKEIKTTLTSVILYVVGMLIFVAGFIGIFITCSLKMYDYTLVCLAAMVGSVIPFALGVITRAADIYIQKNS